MRHSPGFTLIEVLVTITVLATGIVTALTVVRASADKTEHVAEHQLASQAVETLLTEMRLGMIGPGNSGQSGAFLWAIEAAGPCWLDTPPVGQSPDHERTAAACALQPVTVVVRWGDEEDPSQLKVETVARVEAHQQSQ